MNKLAWLGAAALSAIVAIPAVASAESADAAAIRKILNDGCDTFVSGKAAASVDLYLPTVMVFDIAPPRQKTHDQVVKFNKMLLDSITGKPTCVYEEINPVILTKKYAYSTGILHTTGQLKAGGKFDFRERTTDVWEKVNGQWRVMHEHNSVPVDVITGKADLQSRP